jgi:hypothetical protein
MAVINPARTPMQNKQVVISIACLAIILIGVGIVYVYEKNLSAPVTDLNKTNIDAPAKRIPTVLPKSKVTVEYYDSYNATVNDFVLLENTYRDGIAPLLQEVQAYIAKQNLQGLTDLGTRAQEINDAQKERIAILSSDFDNLAANNATLTDQTTKDPTTNFIAAGRNIIAVYSSYSKLIDDIISGDLSSQSVTDAKTIASNSDTATASFREATTKLTSYFSQTLGNDLKVYLMASSTKKK